MKMILGILVVGLLAFIAIELYVIDMGIKVMNSNIVEICQYLNPDDEVTTIKDMDDYKSWLKEREKTWRTADT